MRIDRRVLGGTLATALLVAACGGSASPAPSAAASAAASPAPSAAASAASTPAASQPAPGASQEPTQTQAPGAAGDLAAKLPSQVNGVTFTKASFDGGVIPGGIPIGTGDEDLGKFLADNGKSLSDVQIAMATATGSASGNMVMAIQVKGVPSDKLLAWTMKGSSDMPKTNVGGKDVFGAAAGGFGVYFYVKDDVVYYVLAMGGDATMAEGILKQLP